MSVYMHKYLNLCWLSSSIIAHQLQ